MLHLDGNPQPDQDYSVASAKPIDRLGYAGVLLAHDGYLGTFGRELSAFAECEETLSSLLYILEQLYPEARAHDDGGNNAVERPGHSMQNLVSMQDLARRRCEVSFEGSSRMPGSSDNSQSQKAAEADIAAFRDALGPFVTAAETTRMPMIFTDANSPNHPIVFANQAFLKLSGYEEHEVLGQSFYFMMERGIDPEMLEEIQTAFDGGRDLEPLVAYRRKDNVRLWLRLLINPVRGKKGEILQHFASFVDVTAHKDEEDRLRNLLGDLGLPPMD